jgi:hypothetical protein
VRPGADALRVAQQHERPVRQAVEQQLHRVGAVEQGGRQRLHALDRDALGELVEDLRERRVCLCQPRRAGPHRRGEQQLPARRRPQPLDRLDRALVGDRERTDLLDLVAPELHPQRVLLGRREHVEDAAANRELSALGHQVDPGVRHVGQPPGHALQLGLRARCQLHRRQVAQALQLRLQDRAHRGHDDPHRAGSLVRVSEPAQDAEAAADGVRTGRQPLVWQRLPGREHRDLVGREQPTQRRGQVLGLSARRGHREHRPPGPAAVALGGDRRDDERTQRRGGGHVEGVGLAGRVRPAVAGEVTGAGQPGVGEGGRQ